MSNTTQNKEQLHKLFEEYKHLAETTLYRTLGNPHEVARSKGVEFEDLLQIAYMGVWNACLSYKKDKSSFQTHVINSIKWTLFPSLANDFNVFKYPTNRIPEEEDVYTMCSLDYSRDTDESEGDLHDMIADNSVDNVEDIAVYEALLENYVTNLTDRQREVVQLKFDGYSNVEIAEQLGLSRQAIYSIYKTTLKKIKKSLAENQ